jgi:hypothetical protein
MAMVDAPPWVTVGTVLRANGLPYHASQIITMAWGWGKSAAQRAERVLAVDGEPLRIAIAPPHILEQQMRVIRADHRVLPALLDGLHARSRREVKRWGRKVNGIGVRFDHEIDDDGLSTEILRVVAARLGSNLEDVASVTDFETADDGSFLLRVSTDELDEMIESRGAS